jgi:glycosyltransferase involved in cell wall biosynthesis
VHWLSLKPKLEGLIVQSKFYGIAAAGRPVIAITAADGEIARLVSQNDCGRVIAPGDVNALTETVIELSEKPSLVAEMGRRARSMLDAQFTRMQALGRWRRLVDSIS